MSAYGAKARAGAMRSYLRGLHRRNPGVHFRFVEEGEGRVSAERDDDDSDDDRDALADERPAPDEDVTDGARE